MPDRFLRFDRDDWAVLRAATPMTLRESDLVQLRGINEQIDLDEVVAVYLPLSRLLNLYVNATQDLHKVSATFLGTMAPKVPYVIGVAGSVAVGKSTFARILQALLARWPDHPKVDLVTTDGFLYPNAVLEERDIMNRKGFPESYDTRRLLRFLRELKSGVAEVDAPVYSHVVYDIVEGGRVTVHQPDILILEGLNVLQVGDGGKEFVSDYFDFSIFIDAAEEHIEQWYVERFLKLRESVFQDPESFFKHFAHLDRRAGDRDRAFDLDVDQRRQPAREHPPDPRTGLVDPPQVGRPPRPRGRAAQALTVAPAACSRRAVRLPTQPLREVGQRCQLGELLVVVGDVLVVPEQVVRHVDRAAADLEHRQDVAAHRVAHHQEPVGLDPDVAQHPPVRRGVLLEQDLDVLEVVFESRCGDLARLVHEVALGEQQQPVVAPDLGEHLGNVREELHRFGQHVVAEVDEPADDVWPAPRRSTP